MVQTNSSMFLKARQTIHAKQPEDERYLLLHPDRLRLEKTGQV